MSPQNNYYRVTGYTAAGQKAWGRNQQQVGSGATFNLDSWVPNSVLSWFPPTQAILLEVNGTPTAVQTIANFESIDSSVTITDEGNGSINFQTAGGSKPFPNGGILGLWPGNWLGFNVAAIKGVNVETGAIGAFFEFLSGSASLAPIVPTATQPRGQQQGGAALAGPTDSYGLSDQNLDLTTGILQDWFAKVAIVGTIGRYWFGVTELINASTGMNTDTPAANVVSFRYSAGTDTHIVAVCQTDATHQTVVDTGVFPTFSEAIPQVFEIVPTASGSTINFYINGTLVATISTNVPANTVPMGSVLIYDGQTNGSANTAIGLYYLYLLINS